MSAFTIWISPPVQVIKDLGSCRIGLDGDYALWWQWTVPPWSLRILGKSYSPT